MKVKKSFHRNFKLQGKTFSSSFDLISYSEEFSKDITHFLKEWFDNNDFVVVKTSGSTGEPKKIHLQKKHMENSAKATGAFFNLFEKTTALLCMSTEFIAGKMMLVRALTLGWELDIVTPSSNPIKGINKIYDFCAMVPLQLHNSLNEIHKIKKIIVGGGVVSNDILKYIQNVDTEIFATYGMTETITHIAIKKLNNWDIKGVKGDNSGNIQISTVVSNSKYRALPNVRFSHDSRGCLIILAPLVSDKKLITNDIVKLINDTEFDWLGRYDNIINSGGIKLIPEQIEEKLSTIIKERFFVAGIPDKILGEKLVLIYEGEKDPFLFKKIQNFEMLTKFEKPKEISFLSKFVNTPTEKINRKDTIKLL